MPKDLQHDGQSRRKGRTYRMPGMGRPSMLRNISGLIAIAALVSATATFAAPVQAKRHVVRRWHGYGFLPGYRSPQRIEWEQAQNRGPVWWYGGPGLFLGRWEGGGVVPRVAPA